ncbi:unnamed protein product, partial [Tetraodon nigroviridis]
PTDPVLTQPGLGSTTTTITTITQTGGDWSSGLFDVCGDMTTCTRRGSLVTLLMFVQQQCRPSNHQPHQQAALVLTGILGALVPCCLDLSLAHQFGECLCLPLLPGSTFAMRVGIRERYKIRGSVCEDWTTVYCCYPLAVCQMIREVKRRMKTQTYHV